jgi:uncharacterized protein
MPSEALHRFELEGKRFVIDPETCFCFECDGISWDVLDYFPREPVNRILHELRDKHDEKELIEVIGELEWLRSTKSILPVQAQEDFAKEFIPEQGLKRLSVRLSRTAEERSIKKRGWFGQGATVVSNTARETGQDAVGLLLNRSGQQQDLHVEFLESEYIGNPDLIGELCAKALNAARLAGKSLTASVYIQGIVLGESPPALTGHALGVKIQIKDAVQVRDIVQQVSQARLDSISRLAKALQFKEGGAVGRVVVTPGHADFGGAVQALHEAGFSVIELDMDGAYIAQPDLEPEAMLDSLRTSAVYYANQLLQGKYFLLDPMAALFKQIYDGAPQRRKDPAGANELAVDEDGGVYPSLRYLGNDTFNVGSLSEATIDDAALGPFEDLGSATMSPCRACWARNLCGGGSSAVHHALGGSIRTPNEAWCDSQRSWMSAAVSAFNILSAQGVNFTQVYAMLTPSAKMSFGSKVRMARQAFKMPIALRPAEEGDAPLLQRWENWCSDAYFTAAQDGMLMATQYDREMDALHPHNLYQEFVLIRRSGKPFGLLKIVPDRMPGVVQAMIHFRRTEDYASEEIRKGFATLFKEAGKMQGVQSFSVEAGERESELQDFLKALGMNEAGVKRDALYLHGKYGDTRVFYAAIDAL